MAATNRYGPAKTPPIAVFTRARGAVPRPAAQSQVGRGVAWRSRCCTCCSNPIELRVADHSAIYFAVISPRGTLLGIGQYGTEWYSDAQKQTGMPAGRVTDLQPPLGTIAKYPATTRHAIVCNFLFSGSRFAVVTATIDLLHIIALYQLRVPAARPGRWRGPVWVTPSEDMQRAHHPSLSLSDETAERC